MKFRLLSPFALLSLAISPTLAQSTFISSGTITVSSALQANPYPTSPIASCNNGACLAVSGLLGSVTDVKLTLTNLNISNFFNVAILLQAPNGAAFDVTSNACHVAGSTTFRLTDSGTVNGHANQGTICFNTGDWQATTNHFVPFVPDNFPTPGPGTTGYTRAEPDSTGNNSSNGTGFFANVFNGLSGANLNGVWRLYVTNQALGGGTAGTIGSWSLTITTTGAGTPTTTTLNAPSPNPSFTSGTGSLVTLNAIVNATGGGTATNGSVTFHDAFNNTDFATASVNGSGIAQTTFTFTSEGAHVITATYTGGTGFAASSASNPQTLAVIKTTTPQVSPPAGTVGFCNTGGITLPTPGALLGQGPGQPYSSGIVISGVTGLIQQLRVLLNGYNSTNPQMNSLLLLGPNGKSIEFMAWTGGSTAVGPLNLTFDDQAASQALPNTTSFVNGSSYKPTAAVVGSPSTYCQSAVCNGVTVSDPAPNPFEQAAPAGNPARTLLGQFAGGAANGTWRLYSMQHGNPDTASINNWCLNFTMTSGSATSTSVSASPNPALTGTTVALTATVSNVSNPGTPINEGTVTFSDSVSGTNLGTAPVTNGQAALNVLSNTTTTLIEGTHVITASYNGTANFGFSSNSVNLRMNNPTVQNPANSTRYCDQASPIRSAANGVSGPGFPYPSNILIAGQPGTIQALEIDLNTYNSTAPQTLQSLLVGPCQSLACSIDFFSNPQFAGSTGNINLAFRDSAANTIPNTDSITPIASGTYKPFSRLATNTYSLPAPAGPYNYAAPAGSTTFASKFANADANGTWSFYAFQNLAAGIAGTIQSWCVNLTMNPPSLTVNVAHTGPGPGNAFVAGQTGIYTITVANAGPGSTAGAAVTLADTLPIGVTQSNIAPGADWNCSASTATVINCTSTTPKLSGAAFTPIVVTVNVAGTAGVSATNIATASGFSMTTGNGSDGPTTILHLPILSLANTDSGVPVHTFTQGDLNKSVTFTLTNDTAANGSAPTTGAVTINFTLSTGLAATGTMTPPAGWNCATPAATFACNSTANPALAAGAGAVFTFNFNVAANASTPQTIQASISGGGGNQPSSTDTLTISPLPVIRVNSGSPVNFVAPNGDLWSADHGATGGSIFTSSSPIANTDTPALYQTERFASAATLQYQFPVTAGTYNVRLKFAEIFFTSSNQRKFDIVINGTTVTSAFDIVAAAGAANTAVDTLYSVTSPSTLTIQLVPVLSSPKISAIEITQGTVQVAVTPAINAQLAPNATQQFTSTVIGNANTAVTWSVVSGPGSVSPTGLYTAPASITPGQRAVIRATSAADPSRSASATVILSNPWTSEDIGSPNAAGSSSYSNGGYTVSGAGDLSGFSDSFRFVHQTLSGDGSITARVNASGCCLLPSKAGVMMREATAPGSPFVLMSVYSNIVALVHSRSAANAALAAPVFGGAGVNWVKLIRTGNIFTGYVSSDGNAWLPVGQPLTIPMGSSIQTGLAVASSLGPLYTAIFDNVAIASPANISIDQRLSTAGPASNLTFTASTIGAAAGATWSLSPAAGFGSIQAASGAYTAPASITNPSQQSVTVTATSTADPTKSDSVVLLLSSTLPQPVRVNAGGPPHIDPNGLFWNADTGATSGNLFSAGGPIANTTTPFLYNTERFNTGTLTYTYYVPNGTYTAVLKFAEIFFTSPGQRSMNIAINGTTVQSNFDPFTAAGAAFRAVDLSFPVTVTNNTIVIALSPAAAGVAPKISAIDIH